jgi:methylisocitrate lyase
MTEFGQTPLLRLDELRGCGISLALYPLSAFRAMSRAAQQTYTAIRQQGSQQTMVPEMQTRQELYDVLGYLEIEKRIDSLLQRGSASQKEQK